MRIQFTGFVLGLIAFVFVASNSMAASPDGSVWYATHKSCASQDVPVAGAEKIQFGSGMVALIFLVSQDAAQSCYQADVYGRTVPSGSMSPTAYTEISTLSAQQRRTVCRRIPAGEIVSDVTVPFTAPLQELSIAATGDTATADIRGSTACTTGALHFDLEKK